MTRAQRLVLITTGLLIVGRLVFPVQYVTRSNAISYLPGIWNGPHDGLIRTATGITLLHALALVIMGAIVWVFFLPSVHHLR